MKQNIIYTPAIPINAVVRIPSASDAFVAQQHRKKTVLRPSH